MVLLSAIKAKWSEIAEEGWHHPTVSLPFTLPWLAVHVIAWLVAVTFFVGLYFERERIYEKVFGDHSAGGQWKDFVYVLVYWVIALAITLGAV